MLSLNSIFVKALINLTSFSHIGGAFEVTTMTSFNGPLAVDSILTLGAKTSNSPVPVSLNTAHEGTFKLQTLSYTN